VKAWSDLFSGDGKLAVIADMSCRLWTFKIEGMTHPDSASLKIVNNCPQMIRLIRFPQKKQPTTTVSLKNLQCRRSSIN
jgi:hypothetical protein